MKRVNAFSPADDALVEMLGSFRARIKASSQGIDEASDRQLLGLWQGFNPLDEIYGGHGYFLRRMDRTTASRGRMGPHPKPLPVPGRTAGGGGFSGSRMATQATSTLWTTTAPEPLQRNRRRPCILGVVPKEMQKVSLSEKLALFTDLWSPKAVGAVNGCEVKLVKLKGEFVWHSHEVEDELFLVLEGSLRMQFRDREVVLSPGEFIIVPHGVEHRPVADAEAHVLLLEPGSTVNTGTAGGDRTREVEWI